MTESHKSITATGGCLCGAVRYKVYGPLRAVVNCHCRQCRRTHGHYAAYTSVKNKHLRVSEDHGLKWFQSSDQARRGFCKECGASLFWEPKDAGTTSIAAGTLDQPTGLKTIRQIFVAYAGDYYEISDKLETLTASMRAGE
ncbi:MAG: GFA family protein [Gammaproteobacteria bacterium]|nr:GFA family protein [Gammaproteobacteria bacterium]